MIRRPRLSSTSSALVAVALAATLATGCSSVTGNDVAAKVGSAELSVADFQTAIEELNEPNAFGEIAGTSARGLLTEWIRSAELTSQLAARDTPVDQATRDATAAQLEASNPTRWAELSPSTTDFLVDIVAAQNSIVTEDQVREVYEGGVTESNVICVRFIAVQDQAAADEVSERLAAGESFESLADEFGDPAAAPTGGIFLNEGNPCSAADQLNPMVSQALADVAIGEPSAAVDLTQGFAFFLQRPFDEVTAEATALIEPALVESASADLLLGMDAEVDSRYGMWDEATTSVVPSR